MKFNNGMEATHFFVHSITTAINIIGGRHSVWEQHIKPFKHGRWVTPPATREWYARDLRRYQLHPVIQYVIEKLHYRPINWHLLVLEFPHRAVTDFNRLAYTRDERSGMADKQVITTIGKYLQRHFNMPDHEIRDVVALYTSSGDITIESTMDAILEGVLKGPHSCMAHNIQVHCDDGNVRHPYQVYDPKLGWSIALRRFEGRIDGRALIYDDAGRGRYFVRSYKRDSGGGYSYADEALEAWLKAQGINKRDGWDGARIAKYRVNDGYLAPYLDGDAEYVEVLDSSLRITHDSDDTQHAQETNGVTSDSHIGEECEDCGTRHSEDDMYWVGRWEDRRICECCLNDDYTYVYGRNGNRYYLDNNCVIEVNDEYYDEDYLSDNNIVELADGSYADLDDAVWIESCDTYYDCNDDAICYAEDTGRYELREDCWLCAASSLWYTDDTDYVEVDGDTYHPDEAPETDTNETN